MSMQSSGQGTQEWKARDATHAVTEKGREAMDAIQNRAGEAGAAMQRTVQEQPVISLLGAFAIGIVFGALLTGTSRAAFSNDNWFDRMSDYEPSSLRRWRRRNFY